MNITIDSAEISIWPRRPQLAVDPGGYMESDEEYVLNNIVAAVKLLDAAIAAGAHIE